ncbi:MAG: hypothetical protein QOJ76_1128 [Acidobacteriota bacterium]|nr:hypothetical protein [Acidobacteriota bacterium]
MTAARLTISVAGKTFPLAGNEPGLSYEKCGGLR